MAAYLRKCRLNKVSVRFFKKESCKVSIFPIHPLNTENEVNYAKVHIFLIILNGSKVN